MVSSQALRSLISYSMVGSLCAQRLGAELLLIATAVLAPMGLSEGAIATSYLPNIDQLCVQNDLANFKLVVCQNSICALVPCFDFAQHSVFCGLSEVETHTFSFDKPLVIDTRTFYG